ISKTSRERPRAFRGAIEPPGSTAGRATASSPSEVILSPDAQTNRRHALLREIRCVAGRAGQLQDVQAVIGAVDDVDVAVVVYLDIVGLDHLGAMLLAALQFGAALIAIGGDRRD